MLSSRGHVVSNISQASSKLILERAQVTLCGVASSMVISEAVTAAVAIERDTLGACGRTQLVESFHTQLRQRVVPRMSKARTSALFDHFYVHCTQYHRYR